MDTLNSDTFSIILSFVDLEDFKNLSINKQSNEYLNNNKKMFFNKKLTKFYNDEYILNLIHNSEKYYFKYKKNYYNLFIINQMFEYLIQNKVKNIIKFQIFCYDYIFTHLIQRTKNQKRVTCIERKNKILELREKYINKIKNDESINKKDQKIKLLFNITLYVDRIFPYQLDI
jgi:hypothetical protein